MEWFTEAYTMKTVIALSTLLLVGLPVQAQSVACEKPGLAACRRFPEHKWQADRELSVLPELLRFQWARASFSAGIERNGADARKRTSHGHLADQAGTAFYVSLCAGISSAGHVHGWNLMGR